ncbi:MAG: hypothetical protein IPP32_05400 [Bacteroidetes bacterium]|nr:hypothetical protein [Bacteroidota bacterium]
MKPVVKESFVSRQPIIPANLQQSKKWTFSFEYFKHDLDYFGLGETPSGWFVSLLEKLKELSKEEIREIENNYARKKSNRYHKIDWDAENIPYKRADFKWLKKEILENDVEFPFFQFQVSLAMGRVVGFWDVGQEKFNIILLDTKHNLQPSKRYQYKVDDTSEIACDYTSLILDLDRLKKMSCSDANCACKLELGKLPTKLNRGNFVYCLIEDDSYYEDFIGRCKDKSLTELLEMGLLSS